jgi:hypothetical protein
LQKLEDKNIPKVLVSTKNDVEDLKEVLDEEGIQAAQRFNIPFYIPTTSLKGIGITETFEAISKLMLIHKKGLDLPSESKMVDVSQPQQPEIYSISGSQHISAQPLGIGRVPTTFDDNDPVQPPTIEAPTVKAPEVVPPAIETEEAKPSFTEPIPLAPTVEPDENIVAPTHEEKPIVTTTNEFQNIEPPTEPEKTATQPISSITPPISEQTTTESEEEESQSSNFSFLDRLKEERKKLDEKEEEV